MHPSGPRPRRTHPRSRSILSSNCLPLLLIAGCACAPGCHQSRLFSSPHGVHDAAKGPGPHDPPAVFGSFSATQDAPASTRDRRSSSTDRIRESHDEAVPETELEPVPQRLAKAGPSTPGAVRLATHTHSPAADSSVGTRPSIGADSSVDARAPAIPAELDALGEELGEFSGVDLRELLAALQDAPPEVRQHAIRRVIAMARQRAQPTAQPESIQQAMADSLNSLPVLPDEVIDDGRSPTRLAAGETTMQLSDRGDSETAVAESAEPSAAAIASSPVAQAVMQQPVVAKQNEAVSADPANEPSAANEPNVANEPKVARASASIAAQAATPMPPSTSPSPTLAQRSDAELFHALIARLQTAGPEEDEADRNRREIMRRHLMVLAGDPDRAVETLEGLSQEEQEYLRHQLLGLWTIIDPAGHPVTSRRLSSALPQIREATQFLAAAADSLEIRSLEFCTEIEAYGQIKPFARREFKQGQEVILYCEIENFMTQPVQDGFETKLQGSYDVLDEAGNRVSSQSLPVDRQVSRNQLRDYFIAYQMHLPKSLGAGSYRLRLTMEDVHGHKYGQSEVSFTITR